MLHKNRIKGIGHEDMMQGYSDVGDSGGCALGYALSAAWESDFPIRILLC